MQLSKNLCINISYYKIPKFHGWLAEISTISGDGNFLLCYNQWRRQNFQVGEVKILTFESSVGKFFAKFFKRFHWSAKNISSKTTSTRIRRAKTFLAPSLIITLCCKMRPDGINFMSCWIVIINCFFKNCFRIFFKDFPRNPGWEALVYRREAYCAKGRNILLCIWGIAFKWGDLTSIHRTGEALAEINSSHFLQKSTK